MANEKLLTAKQIEELLKLQPKKYPFEFDVIDYPDFSLNDNVSPMDKCITSTRIFVENSHKLLELINKSHQFNVSSRGFGEVNKNGRVYDYEAITGSMDREKYEKQRGLGKYGMKHGTKEDWRSFGESLEKLKRTVMGDVPDALLLPVKGREIMESGYMYAPYLPIRETPPLQDNFRNMWHQVFINSGIPAELVRCEPMAQPDSQVFHMTWNTGHKDFAMYDRSKRFNMPEEYVAVFTIYKTGRVQIND